MAVTKDKHFCSIWHAIIRSKRTQNKSQTLEGTISRITVITAHNVSDTIIELFSQSDETKATKQPFGTWLSICYTVQGTRMFYANFLLEIIGLLFVVYIFYVYYMLCVFCSDYFASISCKYLQKKTFNRKIKFQICNIIINQDSTLLLSKNNNK